jgi:hypothetical protein
MTPEQKRLARLTRAFRRLEQIYVIRSRSNRPTAHLMPRARRISHAIIALQHQIEDAA